MRLRARACDRVRVSASMRASMRVRMRMMMGLLVRMLCKSHSSSPPPDVSCLFGGLVMYPQTPSTDAQTSIETINLTHHTNSPPPPAHPTIQEYVQQQTRRQWLRGIHSVSGPLNPPDTLSVDTEVLQLLRFFREMPGLRRQIGAITALYYCPLSAVSL